MSNALPKQYLSLDNKPMIYHSINTLYRHQLITSIFVVLAPGDCDWIKYDWSEFSSKLITFNCGGATRAESVQNGLTAAKRKDLIGTNDWILIHDAARPCLTVSQLDKLMSELTHDEVGGLLAVPVSDTLKRGNIENRAMHTEPRENLWQAQTPQMFRYELLVKALENAEKIPITDDASAIEALGFHPKLVQGDIYNFKVTYPKDLALAELIIQQRNNP